MSGGVEISDRQCREVGADVGHRRVVLHRAVIAGCPGGRIQHILRRRSVEEENVGIDGDSPTQTLSGGSGNFASVEGDQLRPIDFNIATLGFLIAEH